MTELAYPDRLALYLWAASRDAVRSGQVRPGQGQYRWGASPVAEHVTRITVHLSSTADPVGTLSKHLQGSDLH